MHTAVVSIYNYPADLLEAGDHMVRFLGQVQVCNLVAPFRTKLPASRKRYVLLLFAFNLSPHYPSVRKFHRFGIAGGEQA